MKKILKVIFFIISFVLIFFSIQKIFIPYNIRIKRWYSFYEIPKDNLDIIFLGSSHSYATYYPEMIDNRLKINSFNMSSNSQCIDQLYFNLKEILKYQKPKIVFIEVFSLAWDSKEHVGDWFIYDNLDGQKFSLNKINSVLAYRKKDNRIDSLLPLIRSHQDWKEKDKLLKNVYNKINDKNNLKIFSGFEKIKSEMDGEITQKYKNEPKIDYKNFNISNFNKEYLEKIKKLSEKYDFKVIYLYSPMYREFINSNYLNKNKKFKEVADLYADDLLDFNLIGKNTNMNERWFENGYIGHQHTSFYGAKKITEYLINYLEKNYTFESRENEKYWKLKNENVKNIGYEQKICGYFELLPNVKIKEIIFTQEKKNYGMIEVRFTKDSDVNEIIKYNLKIHALPKDKEEKKLLKHGYQNWDIGNLQKNLKYDRECFYINREIDPQLNDYVLNLAFYQTKKDKNNKVTSYPNFGKQLYTGFEIK